MTVTGINGTTYRLNAIPIGSGGEGDIYSVIGMDYVAKICRAGALSNELEEKLKIMIDNPPSASVLSQVAWPLDMAYDNTGQCCGFVMPKLNIDAELGEIYKYPSVLPISAHQKVNIAQNICVVIAEVHQAGYVFGDFNPRNIGLDKNTGLVSFLDTDTYHVADPKNGKTYRCNVCAPGYAAPELLEKCADYVASNPSASKAAYAQTPLPTFTQETDNFALAIHIFKLLMNGYTPFGGIIETASVSQSSPGVGDAAVWRDSYCFKPGYKHQSAAIMPLEALPQEIADLFTRAFIIGKANPTQRPSAAEWYDALVRYEQSLTVCADNPLHQYDRKNPICPLCEANRRYVAVVGTASRPAMKQAAYAKPLESGQSSRVARSSIQGAAQSASNGYSQTTQQAPVLKSRKKWGYIATTLAAIFLVFILWAEQTQPGGLVGLFTNGGPTIAQEQNYEGYALVDDSNIIEVTPSPASVPTHTLEPIQTPIQSREDEEDYYYEQSIYIVQVGDTFWGIAVRLLGDGARYTDILAANNMTANNMSQAYVGMRLIIPQAIVSEELELLESSNDSNGFAMVNIPVSATVTQVAQILADAGVVRSAMDFSDFIVNNDLALTMMSGSFMLPLNSDFREIAYIISISGMPTSSPMPTVTPTPEPMPTQAPSPSETGYITIRGERFSTSLTTLTLNISNLQNDEFSMLQYMTDLTELRFGSQVTAQITDFSPLSSLTNLTTLGLLNVRQTSDLSFLSDLTSLTSLSLFGYHPNIDFAPLSHLHNLSTLWIHGSRSSEDFRPLSALTSLTHLSIVAGQLADISMLPTLPNLTHLSLFENQISDVTPLSTFTHLTSLTLFRNQVSDLRPLSGLTNITNLDLRENQISDLSPLSNFTNPTRITLDGNPISDWSPVSHLSNISR